MAAVALRRRAVAALPRSAPRFCPHRHPRLPAAALHAAAARLGRGGAHRTLEQRPDAALVSRLQQSLPNLAVSLGESGACPGCGVVLQSHAPQDWGYVPRARAGPPAADEAEDEDAEEEEVLCQRCHRLRHHNDGDVATMTARQARAEIERALGHRRCIVLLVVDLLDFHGSFPPGIPHTPFHHRYSWQRKPCAWRIPLR